MAGRKAVVAILDQMEEFDEEIRPARPRANEFANLAERVPVKLPPLGESSRTLPRANIEGPPVRVPVGCGLPLHATLLHSVATHGARPANGLAMSPNPYRAWRRPASKPHKPSFPGSPELISSCTWCLSSMFHGIPNVGPLPSLRICLTANRHARFAAPPNHSAVPQGHADRCGYRHPPRLCRGWSAGGVPLPWTRRSGRAPECAHGASARCGGPDR